MPDDATCHLTGKRCTLRLVPQGIRLAYGKLEAIVSSAVIVVASGSDGRVGGPIDGRMGANGFGVL